MKVRNLIIGAVLVIAAVGAFSLRHYFSEPRRAASEDELALAQASPNTITQLMVRKIGASNLLAALGNRPLSWAAIESTNYVVYIQNLRGFGVPEETIRDIIITDIAKLYAKKRAALRAQYPPPPYWQTSDSWVEGESNPELQIRLKQLNDEQQALVKQLLGVDFEAELARLFDYDEGFEDRRYAFLSPERRQALVSIVTKYDDLEQELYERTKGLMLQEDQATLEQLQKMREAEIAQLLSPEELREYELRNSPTAETLREQLSGFDASEDEFRRIFDLQKAYETQLGQMPPGADEDVRANVAEQAEEALNNELRKILGEERFAEYQRAQDADYKTLVQFAERVEMPRETVNRVYDLKSRVEQQRDVVESDPNMTDEQRAIALGALASRARREVESIMGNNAPRYFPVGGHWIDDIDASAGAVSAAVVSPTTPPPPPSLPTGAPFPPVAPFPPQVPFPNVPQRVP